MYPFSRQQGVLCISTDGIAKPSPCVSISWSSAMRVLRKNHDLDTTDTTSFSGLSVTSSAHGSWHRCKHQSLDLDQKEKKTGCFCRFRHFPPESATVTSLTPTATGSPNGLRELPASTDKNPEFHRVSVCVTSHLISCDEYHIFSCVGKISISIKDPPAASTSRILST